MKAKLKTEHNINKSSGTHSTLLIPRKLWGVFQTFMNKRSKRLMLQGLISEYEADIVAGRFKGGNAFKARTLYQDPNQDLIPFHFNPYLESWIKLGQLAAGLGVSRCLLFIMLLKVERGLEVLTGQRPVDKYAHIGNWLDQLSRRPILIGFNRSYSGNYIRGLRYFLPPPP